MQNSLVICLIVLGIIVLINCDGGLKSKIVNITQGPVRGYRDPEGLYVFYNIPYATAPSGLQKFKAPLPPPTWSEPFEAIDRKIVCPQVLLIPTFYSPYMKQQEDCLIANVFVPETEVNNLSVVVYVHGGTFSIHFGDVLTPKNYVKRSNTIVVTFNYRHGLHGFLCLGTREVPGNAGLKDQVAALRWVKNNIAAFGGDPNNVALAGYSSGAACVDIIALSPAATGLFNKVIVDCAVSLITSAIVNDPIENAKDFAVSCCGFNDTGNIYDLEYFYKTEPLEKLMRDQCKEQFFMKYDLSFLFAPCIERHIEELVTEEQEIQILTKPPQEILTKGTYAQVPMLYGFTDMEGLMFLFFLDHFKDHMNKKFADFIPGNLIFEDSEQKENLGKKIRKLYFGEKSIGTDNNLKFIEYFGDILINQALFRVVKMHLKAGHDKIYLYQYTFADDDVPVVPHTNVKGANHIEQTLALFDSKLYDFANAPNEANITDDFKEMKNIVRDIWANFVKTGSPVPAGSDLPAWPAVADVSLTPHMEITLPPRLRWQWDEQLLRRMRFWESIYDSHYRAPVPPRIPSSDLGTVQYKIVFKALFKFFQVLYHFILAFIAVLNFVLYILS